LPVELISLEQKEFSVPYWTVHNCSEDWISKRLVHLQSIQMFARQANLMPGIGRTCTWRIPNEFLIWKLIVWQLPHHDQTTHG